MSTIIGTAHFVSRAAAIRYYSAQFDDTEEVVNQKIRNREIFIGEPPLRPGERRQLCDEGTRYVIVEEG